jgi:hypothetical protein
LKSRGYKYGDPVDEVDWAEVNVAVDIDTDEGEAYWAYGEQIKRYIQN